MHILSKNAENFDAILDVGIVPVMYGQRSDKACSILFISEAGSSDGGAPTFKLVRLYNLHELEV